MSDELKMKIRKNIREHNILILKYRRDIDTMMRLYQIDPYLIAAIDPKDYRWRSYHGEVTSKDKAIPDNLLQEAYSKILTSLTDMKEMRKELKEYPNGTEKEGGMNKVKETATNVAHMLTQHDNPVVHFKGDLFNLHHQSNGKLSNYAHYSVKINAAWLRKVYRNDLAIQDIAGREAMILDADKLPTTPEGYEAYATKVVTIRRPISRKKQREVAEKWEAENLTKEQGSMIRSYDFKHPSFLRYETRYVVRTMSTSGWQSCTGTTVNWAASTLKRRMKTLMLRKLSV